MRVGRSFPTRILRAFLLFAEFQAVAPVKNADSAVLLLLTPAPHTPPAFTHLCLRGEWIGVAKASVGESK